MLDSYTAIIFNLDGVLVDTSGFHFNAWRQLANTLGFDFSLQQHENLRGLSRMASLERILEWGGVYMTEAEKLHFSDIKNNWYQELITSVGPNHVLPGVLHFLDAVRAKGVPAALVSSSKSAQYILNATGLTSYFKIILDGNSFRKSIPDPECFLLASKYLGVAPASCLVFEDSALGVQACLFGGFTAIGVGREDYLEKAHAVIPGFQGLTIEKLNTLLPATQPVSSYLIN